MGFRNLQEKLEKNVPSKLISTHCVSLASLSFLLSLTTTSVYAIAKTLKLHTKCSLLACCCIIMLIVLWSFKLWVKKFDYFLWKNTWHGGIWQLPIEEGNLENTEIRYKMLSLGLLLYYHGNHIGEFSSQDIYWILNNNFICIQCETCSPSLKLGPRENCPANFCTSALWKL